MKMQKNLVRLISILIIPIFLGACTGYNRVVLPKDGKLPVQEKAVILHRGFDTFYLHDVKVTNGQIDALAYKDRAEPPRSKDQELHIYALPALELPDPLPARASIPFAAIERVEVYDVSTGKTIFYTVCVGLAITVAAIAVAAVIIALLKTSCPFIYTFDGERYEFAGEIFSGTVYPPLERHDYLPLPALKAVDGAYRLKLANEVREVQHTNLTELLVIDHPVGAEVLVDKYGVPRTLIEPQSPSKAVTLGGEDVLAGVAVADDACYMGDVPEDTKGDVDGVVLTFDRPREASEAKLVVQGRNTFWLDYVYGQFCELFGDRYHEWYEGQKEARAEKIIQWSLEQGILLSVYVEDGGEWRFVDYYHIAGPMAAKRDVLSFALPASDKGKVKVKLEFGPMFREIDYVAMDFSTDLPVQIHNVLPAKAFDETGRDVAPLLRADDGLYYVQPEIGEYAVLTFPAPEAAEGRARTTILHTKGHYEVLRDPQGKPDLALLHSFEKAGRFIEFSQELFLHYYGTMVSREG
ncbi:MAG: hypothetical protein JSU81_11390 [Candidatus Coatesbacteria bacterium]|nr:MAG: hypothetical protein JSU81_11390 [Candidatus Coatesbacteria bacterium]